MIEGAKPPCSVCGKPSWSRGLCNTHYAAKRYRENAAARDLKRQRNAARRPYSQWTEEERNAARERNRERMQQSRTRLSASYIRARYRLPKDTSALVIETLRTHLVLQRGKRRPKVQPHVPAARFVAGRAMSGSSE